jgi:hypothetical protein
MQAAQGMADKGEKLKNRLPDSDFNPDWNEK